MSVLVRDLWSALVVPFFNLFQVVYTLLLTLELFSVGGGKYFEIARS